MRYRLLAEGAGGAAYATSSESSATTAGTGRSAVSIVRRPRASLRAGFIVMSG